MIVPIIDVRTVPGPTYSVEVDGVRHQVCDYLVAARVYEHVELYHRRYVARGAEVQPPGGWRVVPSEQKARQFAARVQEAGSVNLAFWIPLPHEPAGLRSLWDEIGRPTVRDNG